MGFPPNAFEYLWGLQIDVNAVITKLNALWRTRIQCMYPENNPRTSDSPHVKYLNWFDTNTTRPHLRFCHDRKHLTCFYRFRLGGWRHLRVYRDRTYPPSPLIPIAERKCTRCTLNQTEDEHHVLFECPHYNTVRTKHADLFAAAPATLDMNSRMRTFMNQNSSELLNCISELHTLSQSVVPSPTLANQTQQAS